MKRFWLLIVCMLFLASFPAVAHADFGPKPSLDIFFTGMEGETYYVGLLMPVETMRSPFGPDYLEDSIERRLGGDDEAVILAFAAYQDTDGFLVIDDIEDCSKSHHYSVGRHPPDTFKILIYFPETEHFVVNESVYRTYAFYTYYQINATKIGLTSDSQGAMNFEIQNIYRYGRMIFLFLFQVAMTLAIELGIAKRFHLSGKRVFRYIVIVNLISQTLLTITLVSLDYVGGTFAFIFFYIVLETLVFLLEGILYAVNLKRISDTKIDKWKPWAFSWTANTVSFLAGVFFWIYAAALLIPIYK